MMLSCQADPQRECVFIYVRGAKHGWTRESDSCASA